MRWEKEISRGQKRKILEGTRGCHDCLARGLVFGRIPVSGADLWPKAAVSFVLFVYFVSYLSPVDGMTKCRIRGV